jgi:hemerythrin-like domain-containing protein
LSEDHHHGLVLARKARKAAAGDEGFSAEAVWVSAEGSFRADLEPHFRIEEELIGAVLETNGNLQLAERLYAEHAALRSFFAPGSARSSVDLGHFGELLEAHIRFEERELFEVAQDTLGPAALLAVANACNEEKSHRN